MVDKILSAAAPSLSLNPMAAAITSLSVATPQQPHYRSSLTLPCCLPLQNPHRHQISLTHHCRHALPSLSSPPQSTNGGNFGGSDGGNFGGSGGGSGGDGSEVDNSGDMYLVRKDDYDQLLADVRKTVDEVQERSLPYSDSSFNSLAVSHFPKMAVISVILVLVRRIELKTCFFSDFFRDKNDKISLERQLKKNLEEKDRIQKKLVDLKV